MKSPASATQMIDVGSKTDTLRQATARGSIRMAPATVEMVLAGRLPKGDALETARVAAIMAAKRTPDIIPLCHPLLINSVCCSFECDATAGTIRAEAVVRCTGKTGVEMEALTAVAAALLTIYDMTKGVDDDLLMEQICLTQKSGGRSGDYVRPSSEEN